MWTLFIVQAPGVFLATALAFVMASRAKRKEEKTTYQLVSLSGSLLSSAMVGASLYEFSSPLFIDLGVVIRGVPHWISVRNPRSGAARDVSHPPGGASWKAFGAFHISMWPSTYWSSSAFTSSGWALLPWRSGARLERPLATR